MHRALLCLLAHSTDSMVWCLVFVAVLLTMLRKRVSRSGMSRKGGGGGAGIGVSAVSTHYVGT